MTTITISTPSKSNTVNLEKSLRQIFFVSNQLADLIENILEEKGEYSAEFIKGLNKSLSESRKGKLTKISSLKDILA